MMHFSTNSSFLSVSLCLTLLLGVTHAAMTRPKESLRLQEYHKRNYTWPIPEYKPNTEGWKQHGFGLTRCPEPLLADLRKATWEGFDDKYCEGRSPTMQGDYPWIIERPELMDRVQHVVHQYVEAWAGVQLADPVMYGLRLFRNDSALRMHIDKKGTNAIGFVLHVDSSDDAEPWPFVIEDFLGRTNQVYLTPGDMIIFESSKLMHGRPSKLAGSWYANVNGHYHPKAKEWMQRDHQLEAQYAVPPHWSQAPVQGKDDEVAPVDRLQAGGGFWEPDCPDEWCRTKDAVQWNGPYDASLDEGSWIDPLLQKHSFQLPVDVAHGGDTAATSIEEDDDDEEL